MASLRIVLLCIAAAVLYGITQDQVTARVCVEYFTVYVGLSRPTPAALSLAERSGLFVEPLRSPHAETARRLAKRASSASGR